MKVVGLQLFKSVSKREVRICANHPEGRNRMLDPAEAASFAPWKDGRAPADTLPVPRAAAVLEERAFSYAAIYGCSNIYCWRAGCDDKDPVLISGAGWLMRPDSGLGLGARLKQIAI